MKIRKINIEGFGIHSGLDRELSDGGINVFFGLNERGKTTLAKFLNYAIYGPASLNEAQEPNAYDPVAAKSRHGGSVEFESSGGNYSIARYMTSAKSKKDAPEIRDRDGNSVGVADFESSLRHNVTLRNFNTVFSFDIDELTPIKGKNRDRLDEVFYDTLGGDSGGVSPKSALEIIQKQLDAFYPKGTKKDLNSSPLGKTVVALENLDAEIAKGMNSSEIYSALVIERNRLSDEKKALASKIAGIETKIRENEAWASLEPKFVEYIEARSELDRNSSVTEFPEAGLKELARLEGELRGLKTDLDAKTEELEESRHEFENAVYNQKYIDMENEILALYGNISAYQAEIKNIDDLEQQSRDLEKRSADELQTYLPTWTQEQIESVLTGIEAEDKIKNAKNRIDAANENIKNCESDIESLQKNIERLKNDIETGHDAIEAIEPVNGALSPDNFKALIKEWIEYDRKQSVWEENLDSYREQRDKQKNALESAPAIVQAPIKSGLSPLALIGAVLVTAGLFSFFMKLSPSAPWIGFAVGAALIVAGCVLALRSFSISKNTAPLPVSGGADSQIRKLLDDHDIKIAQTEDSVTRGKIHLDGILKSLAIKYLDRDEAGKLLDKLESQQTIIRQHTAEINKKQAEIEKISERAKSIESNALADARTELARAESLFSAAKANLKLKEDSSAEASLEILNRAAKLKDRFSDRRILIETIREKKESCDDFNHRVKSAASELEERLPESADTATIINIINDKLIHNRKVKLKNERLSGNLSRLTAECGKISDKIKASQDALENLLDQGEASGDIARFRKNAALYESHVASKTVFEKKLTALLAGKPGGMNDDDFLAKLSGIHPDGWREIRGIIEQLHAEKTESGLEKDNIIREEESNKNEISALLGDGRLKVLEQEYVVKQQMLCEQARKWNTLAAAAKALERIAEEDEKKRMPDIKRFASELFSKFTGGAFAGVHIDAASKAVEGVRAGGTAGHMTVAQMSRSVRQELYLAIRLAQVLHLGAGPDGLPGAKETMPVIMDDVLVDIDDVRLPRVISAIRDTFRNTKTQILYFTAHEHILNAFKEACGDSAIISI